MNRVLVFGILAALAGCSSGAASKVEKVPEELRRPRVVAPKVPDRHAYGDITKRYID